jgi:hypothetical protein
MTAESAVALVRRTIDLMNAYELDELAPLLSPSVVYRSPPHVVQFPGNVIAHLRRERQALPNLRLSLESAFADETGSQAVAIVLWANGRLTSQLCLVFNIEDGLIDEIQSFGGLAKVFHDFGLRRVAA